nr:GNAT family N-acetyltransferase [Aliivibrio fischeri]
MVSRSFARIIATLEHLGGVIVIELRKSRFEDIPSFVLYERAPETSDFIIPYTSDKHHEEMNNSNINYLSIFSEGALSGFIILVKSSSRCIELRRLVVDKRGHGLGQEALKLLESYCINELNTKRIWLDVFSSNKRGLHIYNKLGYSQFKVGEHNGKSLLFLEKTF